MQAPNETGKSTWCAFLLAMLYGINSRERERAGFIPDKIRYAPWSGAAMTGRLDCHVDQQALTITRTTRRQTAPLADFHAVYSGTGDVVPDLNGQNCGERLLGVSREVFERSAFIRQSGLAITQDAELERRIASLITSGEEDTSYSESVSILKKQLNSRRHNKTGRIPTLESELLDVQRQFADLGQLDRQMENARTQAEALAKQEALLLEELAQCDRWQVLLQNKALARAAEAAQQAEQRVADLLQHIRQNHIPETDTIARLRGAIVNLETLRKTVDNARTVRDDAYKSLLRAQATVSESPFAGQTAEEARKEISEPPKPTHWKIWPSVLISILGFSCAFGAFGIMLLHTKNQVVSALALASLLVIAGLLFIVQRKRAIHQAQDALLLKRFGTADPQALSAMAESYCRQLEDLHSKQAAVDKCSANADTLYNTLSSNEQAILLEIRRFAPVAFDVPAADEALRQCAQQRKALAEAEAVAREARLRHDLLAKQTPACPEPDPIEPSPPLRSREAVSDELSKTRADLAAARSTIDQLTGQLHRVGDPVVLQSTASHLEDEIGRLESEFTAIHIALEALDAANTTLQNRFAPELGRRAAEIFSELTGNRYGGVTLDRAFHLSAELADDHVCRSVSLLSAGTADQLYLAVRLAVCDLVLPAKQAVPIILDDALANFDDARCAAALRWLKNAARTRQILLFTCHSREADFFANDPEVSIQQLTAANKRV